jgi:hypothetical protein
MEDTRKEMEEVLDVSISLMRKILSKEVAEIYAKYLWEYYKALQKVGFTKEEALKLLATTPVPFDIAKKD